MTGERPRASHARRLGAVVLCGLVLIIAAFVFLHTGSRADAFCQGARFVRKGSLSLWPPGAECPYGEPVRTDTLINGWFWLVALAVVILAAGCAAWLSRSSRHDVPR